jgi:hypothetical protein
MAWIHPPAPKARKARAANTRPDGLKTRGERLDKMAGVLSVDRFLAQPKARRGAMAIAMSRCPGALSRRNLLRLCPLGIGGLLLRDIAPLRAATAVTEPAPETATILIWLPGGASHLDMYDMKPEAPAEYRGQFRPIATNVPGLDICELLPRHSKTADKFSLVRSIAHDYSDHGGGHKRFLTGRLPKSPVDFVNDYPAVGSVVAKMREHREAGVPNYISGTDPGREGVDTFSFGAAYLGLAYTPFTVAGDPGTPGFQIPNLAPLEQTATRFGNRVQLLRDLDRLRRDLDRHSAMSSVDHFHRQALELLTRDTARQAFDLTREPDTVRDRYGRHVWGQRALLARRLVEAGASFVTMVLENPYQSGVPWINDGTYNWDSHAVNCHIFHDLEKRLPIYDQAVTALIEDIHDRGLERRVLVVVTGEFGRTPRLTSQIGTTTKVHQPGRDHWPQAMSVVVAGGGLKMGQVIGSTNSKGEHPQERPLTPNDLWATVYRHLGIDPTVSFPDQQGRPLPILPFGEPIAELL